MNLEATVTRMRLANPADAVDPDEMAALQAAIDDAMAAPSGRRRRVPLRWRPRPAMAVGLALVLTLALFLPLRYFGQSNGTSDEAVATPPSSTALPTTTPPTSVAPRTPALPLGVDPTELRWRRVEMPGLSGGYQWFDSLVAGGPGLIAVGSPRGEFEAFAWTSEDGVEWLPATIGVAPNSAWAFDVTAGGPGYVAVGSGIWASSDGEQWTNANVADPIIGELRAVTVGGPGLVAVGTLHLNRASIYTSSDGLTWSPIPEDGAPAAPYESEITDIVAGGPGLVAVGHSGLTAAVWTSSDGFEWTRVPHDPEVFGKDSEETELLGIAADAAGFVAVGGISDNAMGVWKSTDGVNWSVVPLDPEVMNPSHSLTTIVSTEQGFIVGGDGGGGDAGAWFSPDGFSWTRLETGDALGGPGYQVMSDITVFDDRLVAVGWEIDGNDDSEVVWIAEPAEE